MYDSVVVHYGEIGVKGKNRDFFENRLMENIRKALGKHVERVYKRYGRIVCDHGKHADLDSIRKTLEGLPGIEYFSFAVKSGLDMKDIRKASLDALNDINFTTFGVVSKRSDKEFRMTSQELNTDIGSHICKQMGKKVKLDGPDVELHVEVCEKEAFVYCDKHRGVGGLPVGAGSKLVCSLSGGIDSPVSSFLMMKRGCRVVFVHIYNDTLTNTGVLSKLDDIVRQLTNFQLDSKLYVIPFGDIQKQIIMHVPAELRMIIYRRFMMKIINEICRIEKANGIVTGDSVGQVASQTVENMKCIYQASELPIFPPLIGMNKEEITGIAKRIGTYKHSITPYPDCCSYMIAKHPETKATLERILRIEKGIKNQNKLIRDCISKAKKNMFNSS
jgi:thiamine biosynthesis protein ThiI